MSRPQKEPNEPSSSREAQDGSSETITIWEDTDDLDEILDAIEETWEGDPQTSIDPSRDLGVILPSTAEHGESEHPGQPPSSNGKSTHIIIPEQPDEGKDNSNQCNTSTYGDEDPGSLEGFDDSGVPSANTPKDSEFELQDLSPPSTGESTDLINIPEQPDEGNSNPCNTSTYGNEDPEAYRDPGVISNNTPEQSEFELQELSPPSTGDSTYINIPEQSEDNANQCNKSAYRSRFSRFLSSIGFRGFGGKVKDSDQNDIFTIKMPQTPDPAPGSPGHTKSSGNADGWDETNSDEETRTKVAQRPDSADSGVNSDNVCDEDNKDQERSNPTVQFPEMHHDHDISDKYSSNFHLHTYFMFLYAIGISTYRGKDGGGKIILRILQITGFGLISALAFLYAVQKLKLACIFYALDPKLKGYVTIGMQAFQCISAVYFIKFGAFDQKNVSNMLEDQLELNVNSEANGNRKSGRNFPKSRLALSLGITSVIMAFLATLFGRFSVKRVLAGDPLLHRSFEISSSFFVWTMKNESCIRDRLGSMDQDYGQEFTPVSISLGLIGLLMEFFGNIQNSAGRDLMLLASLAVYQLVANFKAELDRIRSATTDEMDEQLEKFKYLQRVSKSTTNALGMMFAITHVQNLLLFADFLMELPAISEFKLKMVMDAFALTKSIVTYIIAANVSRINQVFRTWIHEQSDNGDPTRVGHVGSNGVPIIVLFDRLKSEPVGLGGGMAFVSGTFIVKLLGYVSSLFLFFSEH